MLRDKICAVLGFLVYAVALPMDGSGRRTGWAQYNHDQTSSPSSSNRHSEPIVHNPSDLIPSDAYVSYYNPTEMASLLVPARQAAQSFSDENMEQAGYYLVRMNLPVSYGTGFCPDRHNEHGPESMLAHQFGHMSVGSSQTYPPGPFYPTHHTGMLLPPLPAHNFQIPYHPQGQHWYGRNPSTQQHSSLNNQVEPLPHDVLEIVKRFSILWPDRVRAPQDLAPQELADEVARVLAEVGGRLSMDFLDTVTHRVVQPNLHIPPDLLPVFWQRLRPLWKSYISLKFQQRNHLSEEGRNQNSSCFTRESDIEKAIKALNRLDQMYQDLKSPISRKHIAAGAFLDMLHSKNMDFAMLGTRNLSKEVREFARQADLQSVIWKKFQTKKDLMRELSKFFDEVKPSVRKGMQSNYIEFGNALDSNTAPEESEISW